MVISLNSSQRLLGVVGDWVAMAVATAVLEAGSCAYQ